MRAYLYILKCSDQAYYVGIANDVIQRISEHQRGKNKFTKSRLPVKLIYKEEHTNKSAAMKREKQIKSWKDRKAIENLIGDGGAIV
ncbi:MAG: hypothetical protein A2Z52_02850 [Candidatus Moranbacteria bacterium RBG_19FT_COMBO_42_6]|nr:MAG: hypothetical protein A2Z52_02850 [Candidatus Moranbacteria bacterium RBG_19FT_COMBO_42_6]